MNGGLLLLAASPCGYMPRVARRTAPHIALLMTTVSTGSLCIADAWCTATGLEKMYDPSPRIPITCRPGSASLTPSAAPAPQPSPAAGPDRAAMLVQQRIFVDQDRVGGARLAEAMADPGGMDRGLRRHLLAQFAP